MTDKDITFLKDLQNELNTQTDDGNAQPVFCPKCGKRL